MVLGHRTNKGFRECWRLHLCAVTPPNFARYMLTVPTVVQGDTAWSIAEEYRGSGQAWPEVVSSNPHANMAKPATGMTVRVAVRIEG